MNGFIAIDHTHPDHNMHAKFDTEQEAIDHVRDNLPNGFVHANPGGDPAFWTVDHAAKTVVHRVDEQNAAELVSAWAGVRTERSRLLAENDTKVKQALRGDRQGRGNASKVYDDYADALVALTDDTTAMPNITWPTKPT